MTPILKVWIDPDTCLAHEACLQTGAQIFSLRDGSYVPVVAVDAARFFASHREEIVEAVLSCPVAAISLQFADGKVITSDDYDPSRGVQQWIDY